MPTVVRHNNGYMPSFLLAILQFLGLVKDYAVKDGLLELQVELKGSTYPVKLLPNREWRAVMYDAHHGIKWIAIQKGKYYHAEYYERKHKGVVYRGALTYLAD